jgi:hypothetical protein
MTKSGTALASIRCYYTATRTVAKMLAIMFEAVFPEAFKNYKKAFEAGVWMEQDPGPWLGRAIVYKLDGALHVDKNDFGPAACIPFGHFSGGQMLVPEMRGKFSYVSSFIQ